jgi:hypothetical protein
VLYTLQRLIALKIGHIPRTGDLHTMSVASCCLKGFEWEGTPSGRIDMISLLKSGGYITCNNPDVAVLPFEPLCRGDWHEIDLPGFMKKNSHDIR